MRILLIGFLVQSLLLSAAYAQPQPDEVIVKTEYFASTVFRETPFADPKGLRPLSADQIFGKTHYAFGYDDQGRLRQIELRLGDNIRPNRDVYQESFFMLNSGMVIDYQGDTEVRRFYDFRYSPTTARGVSREVFTLDSQGRRIALHFEDEQGAKISNDWGIARYEWEPAADGVVVEKRWDIDGNWVGMRPNLPFFEVKFQYDDRGLLERMENYGKDGRLQNNELGVAIDLLSYNDEEFFQGWLVLDSTEKPVVGNTPQVHQGVNYGFPGAFGPGYTQTKYFDIDGNAMPNYQGYYASRYEFDSRGNIATFMHLDADGMLMEVEAQGGIAKAVWRWSEDGRFPLSRTFFDRNSKPKTHEEIGAHRVDQLVDAEGRIIEVRLLNEVGDYVENSPQGFARMVVDYNTDPSQPRVTHFNADGEEIELSQ